jgi:NTE family protein
MNSGQPSKEHQQQFPFAQRVTHASLFHPARHQTVALGFLSAHLPASLISQQLAQSLAKETEAAVVLVGFQIFDGSGSSPHGKRPEVFLNGEFHVPARILPNDAGFYSLTLGIRSEDPPSPAGIASLLSHLSRHFRYVLVEAPPDDHPTPWLTELLLRTDLAYIFLQPSTEQVYRLEVAVREVRAQSQNGGTHVKAIACLAEGERIDGFDLLAQRVAGPIHMFVRGCPKSSLTATEAAPKSSFAADIRRLAREISNRQLGLALSSGAAKCLAHIGVFQVLEENGIEVDVVAGASMGAYVGSIWAYGCDGKEMERLARELEVRWSLWSLIDPVFPPRQGFLRGIKVKERLMRSIGNARFGDLLRPMRVVAGNLATLERVVFASGEVATAVHASIAVPGICVPVHIDGETCVDGGIVDPLPVEVLREMGVARVIAVDAIPTPDRIRYAIEAEQELARQTKNSPRKLFRKVLPLDKQLNYFARGNLFEILMRSIHGAQIRMAEAACRMADLVLRPDICDDRWLDYRNPGKFIALGREVAERNLEQIKALMPAKEGNNGRKPVTEPVETIA